MFYEVVPLGKMDVLTYSFDASLLPGQIVLIPVGRRTLPGVIKRKVVQPNFPTKPITKILYSKPLPHHLLETADFIAKYYLAPLGTAMSLMVPNGVEKQRRKVHDRNPIQYFSDTDYDPAWCLSDARNRIDSFSTHSLEPVVTGLGRSNRSSLVANGLEKVYSCSSKTEQAPVSSQIQLNNAQKNALKQLQEAPGATKLLFGVTGSGKTNIYLKMAENALKQQKSVILLVPEIALTGQLVRVFAEIFGDKITLIHSKQTEAERHRIFDYLLFSEEPRIVIGPRSALFAPIHNPGLIIIDEEHESSYYQENPPRYSAIRVASAMAKNAKIPLILGSATPSIEDFYLAKQKNSLITLSQKAKATAVKPDIRVVDFKNRDHFTKNRYFSNELLKAITDNLDEKRQTLIFHNRRGSSSLTICEKCGEEILCPHCFLPLTLHADTYELVCHTCGFHEPVPTACPKCGAPGIIHKGFGTKLLETELKKLFPKAQIRRFDADNKKGETLEAIYDEVRDGKVDILIGTQTLAKGLDLPKLTTVGVVQADAGLALPDFAAEERVFQLLTQVIGRVGRGHSDKAEVFIQTFRPDHPVISYAIAEDYLGFAEHLLAHRKKSGFPPFEFVMKLEITLKTESLVIRKIREAAKKLAHDKRLIVSPPMPAFHERTDKGYTWQIVVRSHSRRALLEACDGLDKNFKITLDPPSLL